MFIVIANEYIYYDNGCDTKPAFRKNTCISWKTQAIVTAKTLALPYKHCAM